jgi:hypothetical protein
MKSLTLSTKTLQPNQLQKIKKKLKIYSAVSNSGNTKQIIVIARAARRGNDAIWSGLCIQHIYVYQITDR